MYDVQVAIDERIRLTGAALAGSDWRQIEQAQAPHAVHPQAKFTAQFVAPFSRHPIFAFVNNFFAAGNKSPQLLFTAALRCQPPLYQPQMSLPADFDAFKWVALLGDFYAESGIAAHLWADQAPDWEEAAADLRQIFSGDELPTCLADWVGGEESSAICIHPSLTYPMLNPILSDAGNRLFLILPPPKAWGESPPWPFGEGADWALAQVGYKLVEYLLADGLALLPEIGQDTAKHAAAALLIERVLGEDEGLAYVVRIKRQGKLPALPVVVNALRQTNEKWNAELLANLPTS